MTVTEVDIIQLWGSLRDVIGEEEATTLITMLRPRMGVKSWTDADKLERWNRVTDEQRDAMFAALADTLGERPTNYLKSILDPAQRRY